MLNLLNSLHISEKLPKYLTAHTKSILGHHCKTNKGCFETLNTIFDRRVIIVQRIAA